MGVEHCLLNITRCSDIPLQTLVCIQTPKRLASHFPEHFFLPSRLTHLKFKFYLQDWNLFQCIIMIQTFKMLKHCGRVCSPYNLRIDWVPSAPC